MNTNEVHNMRGSVMVTNSSYTTEGRLVSSLRELADKRVILSAYSVMVPAGKRTRKEYVVCFGSASVAQGTASEIRAFIKGCWAVLGMSDGIAGPDVPVFGSYAGSAFRERQGLLLAGRLPFDADAS